MASLPVITGLGLITSIGNHVQDVLHALREGRHGIAPHRFGGASQNVVRVAGPVRGFNVESASWREWSWPAEYAIPRETLRSLPPHGVYAFCALEQALAESGLTAAHLHDGRTGLFCASAGSAFLLHHHLARSRATGFERSNPMGIVSSIAGTLNFNLAAHYGITGSVTGFVSACASSSHALGYAVDEIRLGRQERVLVVAAEEVNADTVLPFAAMRALSTNADPATASRPFDAGRDGFVASGGAAALVLESEQAARARGAPIHAVIAGWGQAADGHSIASPHPEGNGLAAAIENALADAGASPADVDYINAHATSTPAGDRAEALALQRVFTARGARPIVSSTKGLTGHTLSMSGLMEAAFCVLALREGFAPGNPHLVNPDPACEGLHLPPDTRHAPIRTALSSSSGFGGSNVCHVIRAP